MWHEYVGALIASIGGPLAAIVAGIGAAVSALLYHRHKVGQAEKQGRESGIDAERDRIEAETSRQSRQIKEKAREIREQVRAADPDDLAERMRDASSDSSSKP